MHEIVTEEKYYICMFCYLCLNGFCFQGQIQQNSHQLLKYSDIPLNHTAVDLFITYSRNPMEITLAIHADLNFFMEKAISG